MIKNIVLDIGEILLDYRWKEMLADYGLTKEETLEAGKALFDDPLWNELDRGVMSFDDILAEYIRKYPKWEDVIKYMLSNPDLMVILRPKVWERVEKLKAMGYKIYILSNYGDMLFSSHSKYIPFMNDVDGKVVSYKVHLLKPDPEIYKCLLNTYELVPEECIFIDDRKENTDAAKELGINAINIKGEDNIINLLQSWIDGKAPAL